MIFCDIRFSDVEDAANDSGDVENATNVRVGDVCSQQWRA